MHCQDCGAQNDDSNLTCTECGRLLAPPNPGTDGNLEPDWGEPPRGQEQPPQGQQSQHGQQWGQAPPNRGPQQGQIPQHHAPQPYQQNPYPVQYGYQPKSRIAAGVMQLLVPIGIGRFYLGYTAIGLAQLFTALFCGIGFIWAFIDGIIIITGNPPTDANGVPLKD